MFRGNGNLGMNERKKSNAVSLAKKIGVFCGMKFRFLHCADIHFGKGAHISPGRFADYFRAFAEMAEYAVRETVDAVLIAGDSFDEQEPSAETMLNAMDVLRPLRERAIPVYAIEGNHDRRKRTESCCALDILANEQYLHLLRPDIEDRRLTLRDYISGKGGALVRTESGISIAGLGFSGHNPEEYILQAAEQLSGGGPAIVMVHTAVVRSENYLDYGYCLYDDIKEARNVVGYLALGHRHTRVGAEGEFDGWVFNPGSLEYTHPADYRQPPEMRGFFDVTLHDSGKDVRHISSVKRPSVTLTADITLCTSASSIIEAVLDEAERKIGNDLLAKEPIIIVRLEGAFGLPRHLVPKAKIVETLKERYSAVHADVIDEGLLDSPALGMLAGLEDGDADIGDKARSAMAELLRARGIAIGDATDLADALLDWKERLAPASADSVREEMLEEMRSTLAGFVRREDEHVS